MTNIIGYNVYRGADGVHFASINLSPVIPSAYTDAIPNDAEYYYAIAPLFRGSPAVTSLVLSANSIRVFKDSDIDSLPDYYEIANGLDENFGFGDDGPSGDPDKDNMSNFEEYIAGTAATNSASFLFARSVNPFGGNCAIQWSGIADRSYMVYRATNLLHVAWDQIYGPVACASNSVMQFTDSLGSLFMPLYYRVKVKKN